MAKNPAVLGAAIKSAVHAVPPLPPNPTPPQIEANELMFWTAVSTQIISHISTYGTVGILPVSPGIPVQVAFPIGTGATIAPGVTIPTIGQIS